MFGWREAMHQQGLLYDDAHVVVNRSLVGMPVSEEDYYGYSVIVLLNVETRSLGPQRLEIIRRFVERGGGLVPFGRSYDFAPDGYAGTPLEAMMPVTFLDEHSFHRKPEGMVLKPDNASSWKWNRSFEKSPRAFYVQNLVPKENSSVELRAGDQGVLFSKAFLAQFVAVPTAPAAAVLLDRLFVQAQPKLALSPEAIDALAPFVQADSVEPLGPFTPGPSPARGEKSINAI